MTTGTFSINPFHGTGLFLDPLKTPENVFPEDIERDQWHEISLMNAWKTTNATKQHCNTQIRTIQKPYAIPNTIKTFKN